jgi:hypothetical protein
MLCIHRRDRGAIGETILRVHLGVLVAESCLQNLPNRQVLLSASSFALRPMLDWRPLQGILPALFVDKSGAKERRNVDTPVTWRYCFRLPLKLGFALKPGLVFEN